MVGAIGISSSDTAFAKNQATEEFTNKFESFDAASTGKLALASHSVTSASTTCGSTPFLLCQGWNYIVLGTTSMTVTNYKNKATCVNNLRFSEIVYRQYPMGSGQWVSYPSANFNSFYTMVYDQAYWVECR